MALSRETKPELLAELLADPSDMVRARAAANPNTPGQALADAVLLGGLADDLCVPLSTVAANPSTPPDTLELLARQGVVRFVAENPGLPHGLAAELARDPDERVRRAVAENVNAPEETLDGLAHDESDYVRECVAKNPNAPASAIEILCRDECGFVRRLAADPRWSGGYIAPSLS